MAALVEPLACVVHGVEACELGDGADVLVYGAGPIGLLLTAVLAARGHGVVAADPNPSRLDVARVLGARDTVEVSRGGGAGPSPSISVAGRRRLRLRHRRQPAYPRSGRTPWRVFGPAVS